MTDTVTLIAFGASALLMAFVSGVFLAFSDFIMRSLAAATPGAGIEAMQLINRKVLRSVFVVWLLALGPVAMGLGLYAWIAVEGPARAWFIAGTTLYVMGTFMVTILGNVPMNERLDRMAPDAAETRAYWRQYARGWTWWNHLRTVASGGAALALLVGCALSI